MFDVGFSELCLVGLVTLLVIGPQKLPEVARIAGFWLGKARHMVAAVKAEINEELLVEQARQLLNEKSALLEQMNSKSLDMGQDIQNFHTNLVKEVAEIGNNSHQNVPQPTAVATPEAAHIATETARSHPLKRPKAKKRRHGSK